MKRLLLLLLLCACHRDAALVSRVPLPPAPTFADTLPLLPPVPTTGP